MVGPSRIGCWLLACGTALAQSEPPPPAADFHAAVAAAIAAENDVELGYRAATAVLADVAAALPWLGATLRAATPDDARRVRVLRRLVDQVLLGFLEQQRSSGLTYRGQHLPLAALQPFATERLFELLLRPPDWFADTHRVDLVPAIADLQPEPPAPPILLGVIELIGNVEIEPDDLRLALATLVWQWGRKEYVEARVARLRQESADGDASDRMLPMRQLADLWYRVREYAKAASTHAAMQAMANAAGVELSPTDWYWGACYCALSGRTDAGFAALRHCAELMASPAVDPSRKLSRNLFEADPDLAVLRADPRFAAVLRSAFPVGDAPDKGR